MKILNIILSVLIGLLMTWGGYKKFQSAMPSPKSQIELVEKGAYDGKSTQHIQISNYIFGLKQTGYFWQFLGIAELLAGSCLVSVKFRFLGAVLAFPIILNIFLFHVFLKSYDVGGLIQMTLLFIANVWLIMYEYKRWRPLLTS